MVPRKPINSAVIAPIIIITLRAVVLSSYMGDMRDTINKPAVTIVAA